MKLKPKMLMGIGIPLIVVFIIMGFTIYMMASAALRDTVQIAMNQRANHYAAKLDGNVREEISMMETVMMDWSEIMPEGDVLQKAIDHIASRHGVRAAFLDDLTAAMQRARRLRPTGIRARVHGTRRRSHPMDCIFPMFIRRLRTAPKL